MHHPVTFTKKDRTLHKYKYPDTTSETTNCNIRVPNVIDGFLVNNDDIFCEGCYES